MKNVIFIVIDSLNCDILEKNQFKLDRTPFLSSIKDKCVLCNNVISQGPYTEAATKALLTGDRCLDTNGYMNRFQYSNRFITDYFYESGFDLNVLAYSNYLLPSKVTKKFSNYVITGFFNFDIFWNQKLLHFCELYEKNYLDSRDYEAIIDLVNLIFECWIDAYNPFDSKNDHSILHRYDPRFDFEKEYYLLIEERNKFKKDCVGYIKNLFKEKKNHILFKINKYKKNSFIDNDVFVRAFKNHKKFQSKLKFKQFWNNFFYNFPSCRSIKNMIKRCFSKNNPLGERKLGELEYWFKNCISGHYCNLYKNKKSTYKLAASSNNQINKIIELIMNNNTSKKQFYFAHLEEPHNIISFLSYDSTDDMLINKEIDDAYNLLSSVQKHYRGSLLYDLSLKYIDNQIQNLFTCLQNKGELDDSIIIITADHGTSYYVTPSRAKNVVNLHGENFKTPLIIYNSPLSLSNVPKLSSAIDIIPTLIDVCGLKKSLKNNLPGISLFESEKLKKRNMALIEFAGSGSPDLRRVDIWLSARSDRYVVNYVDKLLNNFDLNKVVSIYNLQNDKNELVNIKNKVNLMNNEEITRLLLELKGRFNELKNKYIL